MHVNGFYSYREKKSVALGDTALVKTCLSPQPQGSLALWISKGGRVLREALQPQGNIIYCMHKLITIMMAILLANSCTYIQVSPSLLSLDYPVWKNY